LAWKVAPAIAAGCTVVLKPSELTPLTAIEFAKIVVDCKLPDGVINIVTGLGKSAGEPLTTHKLVDKVAFTGSVPTGSHIAKLCAQDIRNVTLELGGKSPILVFDDVDIEKAVEWIMVGIFFNQGQVCSSTSRVLIQEGIYEKILQRLISEVQKIPVGDGLDPQTKLGPLISEGQYNKVLQNIEKGQKEGASLVVGGLPKEERFKKGYFVSPTVFTNVDEKNTIWNEEIFGPVLCVKTFKHEEEALRLANNTPFGLAGAVMSKDRERCQRVAKAFRAGIVWINCSQPTFVEAPWGGMKKSGTGRELGPWGLDNYLEVKQVTSYDADELGWEWFVSKS